MEVTEQVVAKLDPPTGNPILNRPGQILACEVLEGLPVIDPSTEDVAGHQVHEVKALASLHQRSVVRSADEVTRVVHVDVKVSAVPAASRRVIETIRL